MTASLDRLRALIAESSFEQGVRTVLHRWYCFYETPTPDPGYQGELVTDDFQMIRPAEGGVPSTVGRQAYLDSVAGYAGQTNSHHLETLAMASRTEGTVTHGFETAGPRLNGAARIRYDFALEAEGGRRLPRFSRVAESVLERRDVPLQPSFAENRARAFAHYWCWLLEVPAPDAEPLRELIGEPVAMKLSDGRTLTTSDEVAAWYRQITAAAEASCHTVIGWRLTQPADDRYDLVLEFGWQGIAAGGQPMVAHTRHVWSLAETGERYPRLTSWEATALKPFTPVSAEEALADFAATKARAVR